jgi:hypothetical protein
MFTLRPLSIATPVTKTPDRHGRRWEANKASISPAEKA